MKKSKFSKKFLVFSLVICLICSMLMLTACANDSAWENEPNRTDEDKQAVQNGDFTFTSGSGYPRTPSNWSGSLGGSGSYQPEGGLDALKYGVISVGKDYEYNKHLWNNFTNPKTYDGAKDNSILMIYSNKPSSYSYVSDTFDIKAGKYYKLSFWVYTSPTLSGELDGDGNPKVGTDYGAYVKVSGSGINGEWMDVKTNGKWQKFEMYVEGGANSSGALRVTFGLGYGDKTDKHLTKGHVFFDDVVLEELKDEEGGKTALEQFNEAPNYAVPNENGGSYAYKDSFRFSNASFSSYSKYYTSVPQSPLAWSFGYGGVDDDKANDIPSSDRAKTIRGIINLNSEYLNEHYTDYGFTKEYFDANSQNITYREGLDITKNDVSALMLYADKDYSINYVSSSSITIEKGKIYRLGIWVKALNTVTDKTAKGTIILSNDNEEHRISFDENKFYVDGKEKGTLVKDNNGWAEIVINLRGNNTHDVNYKMTLALGTDGKSQKENWSCGHVLFDDVNFTEKKIDSGDKTTSQVTGWEINPSDKNATSIDLNKFGDDNVIKNGITNGNMTEIGENNLPKGFSIKEEAGDVSFNGTISTPDAKTDRILLPFEVIYKFGNPDGSLVATNVLKFNSSNNTTAKVKIDQKLTAGMNKYYRLAFWVKTDGIEKSSGMNFYLNVLDDKDEVATVNQINEVNSANISEDNDKYNGWQEVVFYLLGSTTTDTYYTIDMSFGRGNKFSETLAKGTAYIYNVNLQEIDQTAYNNASTGSLVKKVDLSTESTSETIANGNFNKLNVSSSSFGSNGKLNKFGSTTNWSVSNDKVREEVLNNKIVKHGTIDLTNVTEIFANDGVDLNIDSYLQDLNNANKNRYALGIYSKDEVIYNYKSNYINLSANSYYSIRVNVFTAGGAKASIKLTSSSPHEEGVDLFSMKESTTGWTEYVFFVKTGLNSASVNLTLSLGDLDKNIEDPNAGKSSGLVLFDKITMTTHKSEDTYNKAKAEYSTDGKPDGTLKDVALEMSFNTDGFATSSYEKEKLNSVNGWNTNAISNAPDIDGRSATLSGILDVNRYDLDEIWKYDDKGETDTEKLSAFQKAKEELIKQIKDTSKGYNETLFGNSVLMIDNQIASGYNVVNASAKELKADKYYKISIWIYAFIEENEDKTGLTLSLKISDRNQDVVKIENVQSTNGWQEFSFYVKNVNDIKDTTLNSYLTLQLGTRKTVDNKDVPEYVKGTVFADNFKIEEVTEEVYNNAEKDENNNTATIAYVPDKEIDPDKDNSGSDTNKNEVDWTMLAWAIPTIVLAVILIAVLGVFLYKKYAGPKKRTKFKNSKTPKAKKAEVHKKDNFDKFDD